MDINYYKKYEPVFGAWTIKRLIGEGSFGQVYEIERNELEITYKAALKTITIPQSQSELNSVKADGMTDADVTAYYEGVVKDIINEFVIMSQMKGTSNIVSYEDHQIIPHEKGIGWDILIRMELLTPLFDHLKEHEPNEKDVIQMGIDICKALELCQKHDIVHRDVKPENIFISPNGDYKLGDFGIARTIEKTTSGLSRKGTFLYMAPEVYLGKAYGSTVDLYSLGLVMYRLLNDNRMPFFPEFPKPITYADRENALIERISGATLPVPSKASNKLAEIIMKACEFDPADRYKTATEMRKDLEVALTNVCHDESHHEKSVIPIDEVFVKAMEEERAKGTVLLEDEPNDLTLDEEIEIVSDSGQFGAEEIAEEEDLQTGESFETTTKGKKGIIAIIAVAIVIIAGIAISLLAPDGVKDISGIEDGMKIYVGDVITPEYVIEPSKYSDEEITFEVSNEDIIFVDENGAIEGKNVGEAVLTIIAGKYREEVTIIVTEKENSEEESSSESKTDSYYYTQKNTTNNTHIDGDTQTKAETESVTDEATTAPIEIPVENVEPPVEEQPVTP